MSATVLELYDRLAAATDDRQRMRILAEAFQTLAEHSVHPGEVASREDLRQTELKLTREIEQIRLEIEQVRGEIKEVELKLTREIEQVRGEIKEVELKLTREIEQVRAELTKEIEQLRGELKVDIQRTQGTLLRWSFLFWITQFGAVLAVLWRLGAVG